MKTKFIFSILIFCFFQFSFSQVSKSKNIRIPFDVSVEKVYVNKNSCDLIVYLKNKGSQIPENAISQGKLRIKLSSQQKEIFLKDIPQINDLNTKRYINYNTEIKLTEDGNVEVEIENVLDGNKSNNIKIQHIKREGKCLAVFAEKQEKPEVKKEKKKEEKKSVSVYPSETLPVFIEPVKNSNISYEKYVLIKFRVPEEVKGKHLKGIFYFTKRDTGDKYYLIDPREGFWFDNLPIYFQQDNDEYLEIWSFNLGAGRYFDERGNIVKFLPIGQYQINGDIYNPSGVLIKNYLGGPFTIVQLQIGDVEGPEKPDISVKNYPLIIENIIMNLEEWLDKGMNLKVEIRGRTRDGSPVTKYCHESGCGGNLRFDIYKSDDYSAKVFTHTVTIKPGRLKVNPNVPSTFGTFSDPLRVSIALPEKTSYTIAATIKYDWAEEKTVSQNFLVTEGGPRLGGDGEVGVNVANVVLWPKDNTIFISGEELTLKWSKKSGLTTRILYSTDGGGSWKKIAELVEEKEYKWQVPFDFTEDGRMKFQWFIIKPEESGLILAEQTIKIKIRGVQLISPVSGAMIKPNSHFDIKWNSSKVGALFIKLFYNIGRGEVEINCLPSTQSMTHWYVPNTTYVNASVRAILTNKCSGGVDIFGESKAYPVEIRDPYISFISPKHGDNILSKSRINISYTAIKPEGFPSKGKVSLFYRLSGSDTWNEIASNLPISGSVGWEVPSLLDTRSAYLRAVWIYPVGDVNETFSSEIMITIKAQEGEFIRR